MICYAGASPRSLRALAFAAILGVSLLAASCASGGSGVVPGTRTSLADLTNPALGPDYAQWLIGPVAFLATQEEAQAFLALKDDGAAQEFIQRFWARRNPNPKRPGNPMLEAFEERGAQADKLYSEAGFAGRRTDRGTVFVIYGRPQKVDFEVPPAEGAPPIEVWTYGTAAASGLNGRKPSPLYRFIKRGDLTVFYVPGRIDQLHRPHGAP